MNGPRYNQWWLYVIDMHNHHAIGDVRHAVNPTSKYRMQLIVQSALAAKQALSDDVDAVAKKDDDEDDLATLLSDLEIGKEAEVVAFCACTRKCATQKCPCLSAKRLCNASCHKNNSRCTNI